MVEVLLLTVQAVSSQEAARGEGWHSAPWLALELPHGAFRLVPAFCLQSSSQTATRLSLGLCLHGRSAPSGHLPSCFSP